MHAFFGSQRTRNQKLSAELTWAKICFLGLFIVVHKAATLHVTTGPADFNEDGDFYASVHWTGSGFQAHKLKIYVLLSCFSHITVGLMRHVRSEFVFGIDGRPVHSMGFMLVKCVTTHFFQARCADPEQYVWRRLAAKMVDYTDVLPTKHRTFSLSPVRKVLLNATMHTSVGLKRR